MHYPETIPLFGALNGLCTSITENKHIKAVKQPWRLNKLAAARAYFTSRGMLQGPLLPVPTLPDIPEEPTVSSGTAAEARIAIIAEGFIPVHNLGHGTSGGDLDGGDNEDEDEGEEDDNEESEIEAAAELEHLGEVTLAKCPARGYPRDVRDLGNHIGHPDLERLIRKYLHIQASADDASFLAEDPVLLAGKSIFKYASAIATFHAPSDLSGLHGMHREHIYASAKRKGGARFDCVFVGNSEAMSAPGFRGLHIARVLLFFSFKLASKTHSCALVLWFSPIDVEPCELTRMWIVEGDVYEDGSPCKDVINIDCILRNAHLIGVPGDDFPTFGLPPHRSLDSFRHFYVNKFADHHSHEIAF
ncbi:hypothetical protein HGRIS_003262 [Hohenbuehelia grisea]|uniref:Uncharacterized protein n=1 Tax=Hohenbuehelia grisea TaxID=104357 RepID=A0ABR3JMX2_9AGAR